MKTIAEPAPGARLTIARFLVRMKIIAALVITGVVLCLSTLPTLADDDDAPPPPTVEAQQSAGRMTIAVLSIVAGIVVFYLVQRYSLRNGDKHPPEWQSKMTRNAVIFAVLSAVLVWGVSSAFTRPVSQIKGHHELEPGRAMP